MPCFKGGCQSAACVHVNTSEEFESLHDRSGQPDVLMGQSIVLSEIKAEVPLQNENPSYHYVLWQQYQERIKLLSQESKVSKFCMDAGFVHVVCTEYISHTGKFIQNGYDENDNYNMSDEKV